MCLLGLYNVLMLYLCSLIQTNEPEEDENSDEEYDDLTAYVSGNVGGDNSYICKSTLKTQDLQTRTLNGVQDVPDSSHSVTEQSADSTNEQTSADLNSSADVETDSAECAESRTTDRQLTNKQSTAVLTVTSPRNTSIDSKPKRVLKVKTATPLNNNSNLLEAQSTSPLFKCSSTETNRHSTALNSSLTKSRQHSHTGSAAKAASLVSAAKKDLETASSSTSPSAGSSSPFCAFTPGSVSPFSASDAHLSPRSDISNLATPRSLVSTPRLPIASILALDIPETSIDSGNSLKQSPPTGGETVCDKMSFTTDESGFTSASSDSDSTLIAPGEVIYGKVIW